MSNLGWHYFATSLDGAGSETVLVPSLNLNEVTVNRVLSGATSLEATVPVEDPSMLAHLSNFRTAIYAELDGIIRGAGLLHTIDEGDAELGLSCVGWTSYLTGQPWPGSDHLLTNTDPFTAARLFWDVAQEPKGANIGLRVSCDPSHTPVRLGQVPLTSYYKVYAKTATDRITTGRAFGYYTSKDDQTPSYGTGVRAYRAPDGKGGRSLFWDPKSRLVISDSTKVLDPPKSPPKPGELGKPDGRGIPQGYVMFGWVSANPPTNPDGSDLEPWPLTWYDVADMGSRWDDLSKDGRFDYAEDHQWISPPGVLYAGDVAPIRHTLRLGYPQLGRRRDADLRFVVGENVAVPPSVEEDGDYYADVVQVRGAGEGAKMKHAEWPVPNSKGRLRRVKVVTDPAITSTQGCLSRARELARAFADEQNVSEVQVANHLNAPLGSWSMGDLITVQGSGRGWSGDLNMTVRVMGDTITPDSGDATTLHVSRSERVTEE